MSLFKRKNEKEEQKEVYKYVRKEDDEQIISLDEILDVSLKVEQSCQNIKEKDFYDPNRLDDRMDLNDLNENGIDDINEGGYDCPICDREY